MGVPKHEAKGPVQEGATKRECVPVPSLIQSTQEPTGPLEPRAQQVRAEPARAGLSFEDPLQSPASPAVKETRHVSIDYHPVSGRKRLNKFEVIRELGRGQHGKVKLGRNSETGEYVAIKTVDRKDRPRLGRPRGSSAEEKIRREIAILKKCNHPNIVRLEEVLDDVSFRKIYLILEYLKKGEVKWQTPDGAPALSCEQAKQVARDTLLGLEYLHSMNIIHRDIKPANLLLSADDVVKISDFGVSYAFTDDGGGNELEMAKTVGTPAFFAPELCVFDETADPSVSSRKVSSKIDIWAYGVTLYCLLYGHLPFDADNEYELFRTIAKQDVELPDPKGDRELALANDLLRHLLDRDPDTRWDIDAIKAHAWFLSGLPKSQMTEFLSHDRALRHHVDVSPQEVNDAVLGLSGKIKFGLSKLANQLRSRSHSRLNSKSNSSVASKSSSKSTSKSSSKSSLSSKIYGKSSWAASSAATARASTTRSHDTCDTSADSSVRSFVTTDSDDTASKKPKSQSMGASAAPDTAWLRSTAPRPKTFYALGAMEIGDHSGLPGPREVALFGHDTSSSDDDDDDDDDDNGELTLVLDRGRGRSGSRPSLFSHRDRSTSRPSVLTARDRSTSRPSVLTTRDRSSVHSEPSSLTEPDQKCMQAVGH